MKESENTSDTLHIYMVWPIDHDSALPRGNNLWRLLIEIDTSMLLSEPETIEWKR